METTQEPIEEITEDVDDTEDTDDMDVADAQETTQKTKEKIAEDMDDTEVVQDQATQKAKDTARERTDDVARRLQTIRGIRRQVRTKTKNMVTDVKGNLKALLGIQLKGSRGPRPDRSFKHKMQENEAIWRIARIPNDVFDDKWKVAMTAKVADLRKNYSTRGRG